MQTPAPTLAQRFADSIKTARDTHPHDGNRYHLKAQISSENDFYAAVRSGDTAVVGQMLDIYPDAVHWGERDWRDSGEGTTGLMLAAARDDAAMLRLLLSRGARVDMRDENLATALFYAAATGKARAVSLLLDAGADPSIRAFRAFDGTALDVARKRGHAEVVAILKAAGSLAPTPAPARGFKL